MFAITQKEQHIECPKIQSKSDVSRSLSINVNVPKGFIYFGAKATPIQNGFIVNPIPLPPKSSPMLFHLLIYEPPNPGPDDKF